MTLDSNPRHAQLLTLVEHLDRAQWHTREAIQAAQLNRLTVLLQHFERHSPWFQERLATYGLRPQDVCQSLESWRAFPITTRGDLQSASQDFHSRAVPARHLPCHLQRTSGSTGTLVALWRTALNQLFWQACTIREHQWHQRDATLSLALVRVSIRVPFDLPYWRSPLRNLYPTGFSHGMPITTSSAALADWLEQINPHYLLIYPSVLGALLSQLQSDHGLSHLRQVRTIAESLSDDLRTRTKQKLGVSIADIYSTAEVGVIAIQCPHSGLYHTMAENLIVEVISPDNQICQVGEIGRVVVTDLYNFASPILRYEIGDFAQVGPQCSCGRGLPTLARILGRQRNMAKLSGGNGVWPMTGFQEFNYVPKIKQYQLIQKSMTLIEVHLVVKGETLDSSEELELANKIDGWMHHAFSYQFFYYRERIPMSSTGKFEEFICEI